MKFYIVTVLCNLLSLGYQQETYKEDGYHLSPPNIGKGSENAWPKQTHNTIEGNVFDQIERASVLKPCTRQGNSGDDTLSPPLPSKVEIPFNNGALSVTLKPQPKAFRNRAYDLKAADCQDPPSRRKLTDNNEHNNRNTLTVSNPVIDSFEENHRQLLANDDAEDDSPLPIPSLHPVSDSRKSANPSPPNKSNPPKIVNPVQYQPNTEYGNQYNNIPTPSSATIKKTEYNPLLVDDYNPLKTYKSLPESVTKAEPDVASAAANKCAHDKEPEDLGHSRRSMSNHNDGEMYPNHEPYIRYAEPDTDKHDATASVLNVEKNPSKTGDAISQDKTKIMREKTESYVGRPQYNEVRRNEIMEPTKREGVVNMGQSSLMLMQTDRICYACSTANNPSCWFPDRRTTVKYCRKGNNACVTKTFGKGSTYTLIRDCGRTCDDSATEMLMPRYKSCSMCHTDLCNGAYSINRHSILFALILIALVKYIN